MDELENEPRAIKRHEQYVEQRRRFLEDLGIICGMAEGQRVLEHILRKLRFGMAREQAEIYLAECAKSLFDDIAQANPEAAKRLLLDIFLKQ